MSENSSRWCVLLPCSKTESWAVPQNCLAEIVTVHGADERPPEDINWRGEAIPVLDFGRDDGSCWRDTHGSALVAVILGLEGDACKYWGLAIRGDGLGTIDINEETLEDVPDAALEHASTAFRLRDTVYQVPDLPTLQRQISESLALA